MRASVGVKDSPGTRLRELPVTRMIWQGLEPLRRLLLGGSVDMGVILGNFLVNPCLYPGSDFAGFRILPDLDFARFRFCRK